MYVFSHLHKAAGTTITHILRRTFGLRHLDVMPNCGHLYTEMHLDYDISHFVTPNSIAGHCLRAYIDYGKYTDSMQWFSIVRDPLTRCMSHYQHKIEVTLLNFSFIEWIQRDINRNFMVKFYGGADSVQKAIDSIHSKKMRIIILSSELKDNMQEIFSSCLLWKDIKENRAKSYRIKNEIRSDTYMMEELMIANELDLELFEYLKKNVHSIPLDRISKIAFPNPKLNSLINMLYRDIVYRPVKRSIRKSGIRS